MGFIFSGAFWGVLLVLLGISILIKVFFNIDLPLARTFFGIIIILLGLSILMGRPVFKGNANTIAFDEGSIHPPGDEPPASEYNVIFGAGVTDLRDIQLKDTSIKIKVNTIFAENKIKIDPSLPVLIQANSAFAEARLPGGNMTAFGNSTYKSPSFDSSKPHLAVEINVVFGSAKVLAE